METWHIMIRSDEQSVLFADEATRRRAVLQILCALGGVLILYCISDNHVHLVVVGPRDIARHVAATVQQILRRRFGCRTEPAHTRPVRGRRHLENLVDYVHRQCSHHGLGVHPALWSASSFPDLVGARHVPGFDPSLLHRMAPRLSEHHLLGSVGLPRLTLPPADELAAFGPRVLCTACADVFAAPPDLVAGGVAGQRARRLACSLGRQAGFSTRLLAEHVPLSERSVRRFSAAPVAPELVTMVRVRLAIDEAASAEARRASADAHRTTSERRRRR